MFLFIHCHAVNITFSVALHKVCMCALLWLIWFSPFFRDNNESERATLSKGSFRILWMKCIKFHLERFVQNSQRIQTRFNVQMQEEQKMRQCQTCACVLAAAGGWRRVWSIKFWIQITCSLLRVCAPDKKFVQKYFNLRFFLNLGRVFNWLR